MRPNLINRLKEEWNNLDPVDPLRGLIADAIDALAEPAQQQEPVAVYVGETWCGSVVRLYEDLPLETPLYTSPQPSKPWVGLTDEEVKHEWEVWRASMPRYAGFAKGIEAKLREKNA